MGALVLCVAGAAKLRAPGPAHRALLSLGLPSGEVIVRSVALGELAIGGWCAIDPSRPSAAGLAVVYALFAAAAWTLARRQASCGCFGGGDLPASPVQAIINALIALTALGQALAGPHGLTWVLGRPAGQAAVLALAAGASTWAAVLAYTALPRAWSAWSPR